MIEKADLREMIKKVMDHPDSTKMGMILTHIGIVRGNSRNGRNVKGIKIRCDNKKISRIIEDIKKRDGIIEIVVQTNEGLISVGEMIMVIVVGGDIREHVFPAIMDAINRIKAEACIKEEILLD